jgi:hypothetical protein
MATYRKIRWALLLALLPVVVFAKVIYVPSIRWDDVRTPASAINPAGPGTAMQVSSTDGSLYARAGNNDSAFFEVQIPHGYAEGHDLDLHIHGYKATSAAGTINWQLKCTWTNIGDVFSDLALESWVAGTVRVADADTAGLHYIREWEFDGSGKTISSVMVCAIRRNSLAGADSYGADAHIVSIDAHVPMVDRGSVFEWSN